MRIIVLLLALVVGLAAAGCGSDGVDGGADDGSTGATGRPQRIPEATGEVRTRGVVTVRDDGSGPQLCLGPVAESWPPQCSGPPLLGWEWRRQVRQPGQPGQPGGGAVHEQAAGVRWGQYALAGRWDGESFTVTASVPGAQYDPAPEQPERLPEPEVRVDPAELRRIADDLAGLPGALTSHVDAGRVHVDVTYDDGSLQAWADQEYGESVVVVIPMLLDVAG